MADVRFEGVRKTFGKVVAVDDVDLEVADGDFVVLLGPSGCGKTTLLRCLAGLEKVDSGRVLIGGRDATDLPPRRRRIAMVFQSYAVFPHLNVFKNIAFGLRMQKEPKAAIRERVESAAKLLHIEDLLDRYPSQISGGQRQRVAVARAVGTQAGARLWGGGSSPHPSFPCPGGRCEPSGKRCSCSSARRRSTSHTIRSRPSA